MYLCCSPHLYIYTLPICNKPLWRDSCLRWPLLSCSLLDVCIPRISPAFWATSREMSLMRLLGSLVIFTTKQKRDVRHYIKLLDIFISISFEPLVNQLRISTCRHKAHIDIYNHCILFLVNVFQLLPPTSPWAVAECVDWGNLYSKSLCRCIWSTFCYTRGKAAGWKDDHAEASLARLADICFERHWSVMALENMIILWFC